MKGLHLL